MSRIALVAAGSGLSLLIAGIYGISSIYTMTWGVPVFVAGLLTFVISTIFVGTGLMGGSGRSTGFAGRMKNFLGTGNRDLIGTGVPAPALITGMRDTGTSVNDQVVVAFDLQVRPHDGAPYPVSHRQILPRLLMGAILPGRTVQVWTDAADPTRLAIDWSAMPAQSA
ncbi:hypothetical protein JOL79_12175 [Microbispora sp. RL4-1S]|uniref:Uncharacterized protein n=1 Tax=Microbispora oryzae TaxID=2806554 RepID=A0A940WJS6_9ACTN|nr:hypothetical protein [Microbispora oryzae]MBP2704572.1 hypothetical protein [Microbispora oryzae]